MHKVLIDKPPLVQVWINPSWRTLVMVELLFGVTFRFSMIVIHLFGNRLHAFEKMDREEYEIHWG